MSHRPPKTLPLTHMARQLGVTCAWLRAEAKAGRIPHLDADGRLLFRPDAVQRVIAERATQAHPGVGVGSEVAHGA